MHASIQSPLSPRGAMGRRLPIRVALASLFSLAWAGCGEKAASERETSGGEAIVALAACELVTRDDVAKVLQSPVGEPQSQVIGTVGPDRAGINQCTFTATGGAQKSVSIFLRQSPVADNNPAEMRQTMTSAGTTITDVTGVGDAAFWDGRTLHVFSGGKVYFTITVAGIPSPDQVRDHAKTLALTALGRINAAPTR